MIINAAVQEILKGKPGDEIVVANEKEYYNCAPIDGYGNSLLYKKVTDVIKENGKVIILTE